jgi:hypothetical protein
MPFDRFHSAPRSTQVIASHRHGEAPDPCRVPKTQSSSSENELSETPSTVRTLYFICCRVYSNVDTAAEHAPRQWRAMPPIEGTMQSNAALQLLLNIIAECLRRERPSYDRRFNRIASVKDLSGQEPHWDIGIVPRPSALCMRRRPKMILRAMLRSASNS